MRFIAMLRTNKSGYYNADDDNEDDDDVDSDDDVINDEWL